LIDYGRSPETGLLISVGSGLMMASMDIAMKLHLVHGHPGSFKMVCDPIVFVAWFSSTNPRAALVLKGNHPEVHCYFRGFGADTTESWDEIMERGR
jgi:hypothetical protein